MTKTLFTGGSNGVNSDQMISYICNLFPYGNRMRICSPDIPNEHLEKFNWNASVIRSIRFSNKSIKLSAKFFLS